MIRFFYIFQIGIILSVFEKFEFWRVTAGWRRGAQEIFFGDHVRNENLGKVTKFGYHTITGVDMPEPNAVLRAPRVSEDISQKVKNS